MSYPLFSFLMQATPIFLQDAGGYFRQLEAGGRGLHLLRLRVVVQRRPVFKVGWLSTTISTLVLCSLVV